MEEQYWIWSLGGEQPEIRLLSNMEEGAVVPPLPFLLEDSVKFLGGFFGDGIGGGLVVNGL